jgi:hypothetical protein
MQMLLEEEGYLKLILGSIITHGGPVWTVPELVFEKKHLIPALQQLLVAHCT